MLCFATTDCCDEYEETYENVPHDIKTKKRVFHTSKDQVVAIPSRHEGDEKYKGAIPQPRKKKEPQIFIELNAGTVKMH